MCVRVHTYLYGGTFMCRYIKTCMCVCRYDYSPLHLLRQFPTEARVHDSPSLARQLARESLHFPSSGVIARASAFLAFMYVLGTQTPVFMLA